MSAIFDPNRIISRLDVPTYFCHGTRHVEFLEGGLVRNWLCEDIPSKSGLAPMSRPVAVVIVPMACYVWNILAQAEHAFDHGIMRTRPNGPCKLRPERRLLM